MDEPKVVYDHTRSPYVRFEPGTTEAEEEEKRTILQVSRKLLGKRKRFPQSIDIDWQHSGAKRIRQQINTSELVGSSVVLLSCGCRIGWNAESCEYIFSFCGKVKVYDIF